MSAHVDELHTTAAPERRRRPSPTRRLVERHAPTVIKFLATMLAAGVVAYGAAQRKAGTNEARDEARLAGVERQVDALQRELVPRAEHAARWEAQEQSAARVERDLREVRDTATAILLKLSSPTTTSPTK